VVNGPETTRTIRVIAKRTVIVLRRHHLSIPSGEALPVIGCDTYGGDSMVGAGSDEQGTYSVGRHFTTMLKETITPPTPKPAEPQTPPCCRQRHMRNRSSGQPQFRSDTASARNAHSAPKRSGSRTRESAFQIVFRCVLQVSSVLSHTAVGNYFLSRVLLCAIPQMPVVPS
jgi:hypothetical protein